VVEEEAILRTRKRRRGKRGKGGKGGKGGELRHPSSFFFLASHDIPPLFNISPFFSLCRQS